MMLLSCLNKGAHAFTNCVEEEYIFQVKVLSAVVMFTTSYLQYKKS